MLQASDTRETGRWRASGSLARLEDEDFFLMEMGRQTLPLMSQAGSGLWLQSTAQAVQRK